MHRRNARAFRELRRIKRLKIRKGKAVGRNSEDILGKILGQLRRERRIRDFERVPKYSPEDLHGIDYFIYGFDGRRFKVDVKSSEFWIKRRNPNIIYIIVGLEPDRDKILSELRRCGVIG